MARPTCSIESKLPAQASSQCPDDHETEQRREVRPGPAEAGPQSGFLLAADVTDSDFVITSKWQELGGSTQAVAYFQRVDEIQEPHLSLLASCSSADEDQAKQTCSKHLGCVDQGNAEVAVLNDCIFDICHGAGEDSRGTCCGTPSIHPSHLNPTQTCKVPWPHVH